jgi:hypothetical protein
MKKYPAILVLAVLAACANTGDKQKDAALNHNQVRTGFNSAVQGVTLAIRSGEIKKEDARQFIVPLVLEGQKLLDDALEDIKAGREPRVDVLSAVLRITSKILAEQARLAAEGE